MTSLEIIFHWIELNCFNFKTKSISSLHVNITVYNNSTPINPKICSNFDENRGFIFFRFKMWNFVVFGTKLNKFKYSINNGYLCKSLELITSIKLFIILHQYHWHLFSVITAISLAINVINCLLTRTTKLQFLVTAFPTSPNVLEDIQI